MANENRKMALLVMDVQPGIVDRLADRDTYMAKVTRAVEFAHAGQIPVIHVVVGFRPGAPEASGVFKEHAAGLINPRPAFEVADTDLVVTKRRVSAFTGSDLEVILRAQKIGHLVLAGIATSGVVLSTIREAADKDYQLTVLSDLCADFDAEVHSVLINKVFPRQARVATFDEWARTH
jgi:nicotinamidase-related amidase